MVTSCIVPGCRNRNIRSRSDKYSASRSRDVTFHRVPQTPQFRDKWVAAISTVRANYQPTSFHHVCSDHFRAEDYDDDGFRRILKKGIAPTFLKNVTDAHFKKKQWPKPTAHASKLEWPASSSHSQRNISPTDGSYENNQENCTLKSKESHDADTSISKTEDADDNDHQDLSLTCETHLNSDVSSPRDDNDHMDSSLTCQPTCSEGDLECRADFSSDHAQCLSCDACCGDHTCPIKPSIQMCHLPCRCDCHDNNQMVKYPNEFISPTNCQETSASIGTSIMQTSSRGFTVEQVELIRRLRNSGVTSLQIMEAFQALDRIDAEFGSLYAIPTNLSMKNESQSTESSQRPPSASQTDVQVNPSSSFSVLAGALSHRNNASSHQNSRLSHSSQTPAVPNSTSPSALPVSLSFKPTSGPVMSIPAMKFSDTLRDVAQASMSGAPRPTNSTKTAVTVPEKDKTNNSSKDGSTQNSPKPCHSPSLPDKSELREMNSDRFIRLLLGLNGETLRMLVQKFVMMIPEFDQQKHAAMLGVDDVTLYNFLNGHWQAIESSARGKIFSWFYHHVKSMDWFFEDLAQLLKMRECSEGLDVHFVPRRERFTFRDKHIEVLEMFFKKGQYPSQEEKEHIANECNLAMSMGHYRELTEKEKMSHINVTNWFSNRRKEIKRLAKQGGIDTEQVILPSRLKNRVLSHLPTYNELQEEQAARQKVLGLSPSTPASGCQSESYVNYSEHDSSSQENSNPTGHFPPTSSAHHEAESSGHGITAKTETDGSQSHTVPTLGAAGNNQLAINVPFPSDNISPAVPQTLVRNEHSMDNTDSTLPADRPIKFEPMDD